MINNGKVSELINVDVEAFTASTGASSSLNYSMENYGKAFIGAALDSTGFTTCTLDLMESSAATVAGTSAAGSKAGITLGAQGGTGITTAGGVRTATLTLTTDTTGNTPSIRIQLGDVARTLTYTTATASIGAGNAANTTLAYWGSTVGATAAGGLKAALDTLSTVINAADCFNGAFNVSTDTTATIKLAVKDTATGPIALAGDTGITVTVQHAVGGFNINADQLDSTANKKYIGLKKSTVGTAAAMGVVVARGPGRYMPAGRSYKGYIST